MVKRAPFWQASMRPIVVICSFSLLWEGGHVDARSLRAPLASRLHVRLCATRGITVTDAAMAQAILVVQSRVTSGFKVSKVAVVRSGARCIGVDLTGTPNVQRLRQVLSHVGYLVLANSGHSFLDPGTRVRLVCHQAGCGPGLAVGRTNLGARPPTLRVIVAGDDVIPGLAKVGQDPTGSPTVTYSLNAIGSQVWCRFTGSHLHQFAAIVLDSHVLSDPMIQGAICSDQTQVAGLQSISQARTITAYLNSGPLPFPFRVRSVTTLPLSERLFS